MDIFGTLGPSCQDPETLYQMFEEGMTGIRINLSHIRLSDCRYDIENIHQAAQRAGIKPKLLIDLIGSELRIGSFDDSITVSAGDILTLGEGFIPLDQIITERIIPGSDVLLDDGHILGRVTEKNNSTVKLKIIRGGSLSSNKSIAISGLKIDLPSVNETDIKNLSYAKETGITGVMLPFVKKREDLVCLKDTLKKCGTGHLRIYAKIENAEGYANLPSFIDDCDEIIIARGDLGNSMPLWELPRAQKRISAICRKRNKPFMVVTQMLTSMEHSSIPTRAEVSDIYNAVLDGASSVMVTGETAIGDYPVDVIKYLSKTASAAITDINSLKIG